MCNRQPSNHSFLTVPEAFASDPAMAQEARQIVRNRHTHTRYTQRKVVGAVAEAAADVADDAEED